MIKTSLTPRMPKSKVKVMEVNSTPSVRIAKQIYMGLMEEPAYFLVK
jgi:hypothetical protein